MTASTSTPHAGIALSAGTADEDFSPARMIDVELAEQLPIVRFDGQHRRLWVLGRLHTEPIGVCTLDLDCQGLTADELGRHLWPKFCEPVRDRYIAAGLPEPTSLPGTGLEADPSTWPFLCHRLAVLAAPPFISVVICTRDRPTQLEVCLRCLAQQQYPLFEVVVVDNAPTSNAVRTIVEAEHAVRGWRYIKEPRPGLSWARNAGISAANGEIVAFIDDDDEPDSQWLAGLVDGFSRGDDVGCVSGLVLPARLDTPAQDLFEQLGGLSKGRGFSSAIFSRHGPQSPLFPLPPFGVGANMAFRREALARIGGFDVALGAGTPTFSGEDTLALTLTMLAGYRIAYEPTALMRHNHRPDLEGLGIQLRGYAVGLTAYYAALLRHRPRTLLALSWLIPRAIVYLRGAKSTPVNLPVQLKRRQRLWMLRGPLAYISSLHKHAVSQRQQYIGHD